MIIDISQKQDGVEISYINNNKNIEVITTPAIDYYNYVECDEFDPNRIPDLLSFKGSPIKKDPSKYFTHHNVNEFLSYDLKIQFPEIYEKTSILQTPIPFSVDIETDVTDEYGYSDPTKAENKILSICITDINLNSLAFILKNDKHPEFDFEDMNQIRQVLNETLEKYASKYEYRTEIKVFDTEVEMLNAFLIAVNKYFHSTIGWNYVLYDILYIANRCKKLNIDFAKCSPVHRLKKATFKLNKRESVQLDLPWHRIMIDYMQLFKDSLVYNNLGSYSLNSISDMILGLQKVSYEGNLRKLYEENFVRFIGYAFVDTILVMLIHKAVNLYDINFFQSYYTNVPYLKLSQNSISEALVYQELRENNRFLLESEKNIPNTRPYKGGYVKSPTKKVVKAVACIDAKSLYPNCIRTAGISPELKIDQILVNEFGRPANIVEEQKWEKYKALGYGLSFMGRVYDMNTEGLFYKIETKLLNQRKIFKGHASDIYLNLIPKLEDKLKELDPDNNYFKKYLLV